MSTNWLTNILQSAMNKEVTLHIAHYGKVRGTLLSYTGDDTITVIPSSGPNLVVKAEAVVAVEAHPKKS